MLLQVLDDKEKQDLVNNIAAHLKNAVPFIQKRAVENFSKVHADFGTRLQEALNKYNAVRYPKHFVLMFN